MLLVFALFTVCYTCETELRSYLDHDLVPRIKSFHLKQSGLDWFGDFHTCASKSNSTYSVLSWKNKNFLLASYGLCVPITCNLTQVNKMLSSYASASSLYSNDYSINFIQYPKPERPSKTGQYFFPACFLIIVFLNIYSTLFQRFINKKSYLYCFNISNNIKTFVDISKPVDNLSFLDGIRTICSVLIVLLHCEFFYGFLPIENRAVFNDKSNSLQYHLIKALNLCVDIFFYIAGFLMSFLTVKEVLEKGEKFSWLSHVIRRVIRYLPAYLLLIGFERSMPQLYPETPSSIKFYLYGLNKQTPWWASLLFIQNFVFSDDTIYLGWTWTICADFQFFLISSPIIYLYCKNKKFAYFSAFFIIFLSFLYTFFVSYTYGLKLSIRLIGLNLFQMNIIYFKPLPRLIPYLIGVIIGLIYYSSKKKSTSAAYSVKDGFGEKFEKVCLGLCQKFRVRLMFYCIGLVFIIITVFLTYFFTCYPEEYMNKFLIAAGLACYRLFFIIGISFFMLPLKLGYLEGISKVLKFKAFRISAKLSYCIYLIHPFVFIFITSVQNEPTMPDLSLFMILMIKVYFISFVISTLVYVLIESPIFLLERKIITR